MTEDWRGPINQILFGLIFTHEITDEVVEWNANSAIRRESLDLGPGIYCRAIGDALSSGEQLDGLGQVPQFSQEEIADFLEALASRLDSMRPWPEPPFRVLDSNPWRSFRDAVKIAELDVPLLYLSNVFRSPFQPIEDHKGKYFLMVTVRTGETVALVGSYERGERVSVLSEEAEDPDTVVNHFLQATGIPSDKIVRV